MAAIMNGCALAGCANDHDQGCGKETFMRCSASNVHNRFCDAARHLLSMAFALLLLGACTVRVETADLLKADGVVQSLDLAALDPDHRLGDANLRLEPLEIRHTDGVTTRGIHLVKPESKFVVIYLSGNQMRLMERGVALLPRFAQLDADLLWMDYRGQGVSDGSPSIETLLADAMDLLALADRLGKPVVVHGLSMGSVLAVRTARDRRVSGLALEGALTNVPQVVEATTPDWLRAIVTIDVAYHLVDLDNIPMVADFDRPILLLAGQDDGETPPILSERLYRAATSAHKALVMVPEAGHPDAMLRDAALGPYRAFLADVAEVAKARR